jgi:hypothetical protein
MKKIKPGDEVFVQNEDGTKGFRIVTHIDGSVAHVLDKRGIAENDFLISALIPTGRHFRELEDILSRIGAGQ